MVSPALAGLVYVLFCLGELFGAYAEGYLVYYAQRMGGSVPTDQEKQEFVKALVKEDLGRIVVCNVVDGHADGHLMKTDVKQYFEWWIDLCKHKGLKSITSRLAAMNTLQNSKYPNDFKVGVKRPDFRFRCPERRPRKQGKFQELCSTVPGLVLSEVIDDTTRDALKAKSIHLPVNHSNDWADDFVRAMMDIPDSLRTGRLGAGKSIGRHSGSVWITGKPILDKKLAGYGQPADRARDVLGLVHRKPPEILVAIHFPWAVTGEVPSARPTFMDAGGHRRFRAQADARHRRRMAAWGHTVDLAKVSAKAKNVDGLPERVCGAIDSGALAPTGGKFGFTTLGRVTTKRGHSAETHGNDAAFARRMANGRTNCELANALLRIIV